MKYLKIFIVAILFSCNNNQKKELKYQKKEPIVIEPFYAVNQTAMLGDIRPPFKEGADSSVIEYFLINQNEMNDSILIYLDSFSCNLLGKKLKKYNQHSITYYRKSDKTNNEYLLQNTRTLARFSQENDLLIKYRWLRHCNNGFRSIYKKGVEIINERIDCDCTESSKK